jgi:hypothetical protein
MESEVDLNQIMLGNSQFRHIQAGLILYKNAKIYRRRATITASKLFMETITLMEQLLHYDRLQQYIKTHGNFRHFIGNFHLGFSKGETLPQAIFCYYQEVDKTNWQTQKKITVEKIANTSAMVNSLSAEQLIEFYLGFAAKIVKPVTQNEPVDQ